MSVKPRGPLGRSAALIRCDDRVPTAHAIVVVAHHLDDPFAHVARVEVAAHSCKTFENDDVFAAETPAIASASAPPIA
jgi:hypothetical protein